MTGVVTRTSSIPAEMLRPYTEAHCSPAPRQAQLPLVLQFSAKDHTSETGFLQVTLEIPLSRNGTSSFNQAEW